MPTPYLPLPMITEMFWGPSLGGQAFHSISKRGEGKRKGRKEERKAEEERENFYLNTNKLNNKAKTK